MARRNRYIEALKDTPNLIGLASAAALSAALLNPLPLLVGLVAEAAYLLFIPDSAWFQKRLAEKEKGDARERRQQLRNDLLPTLRPLDHNRFKVLEDTHQDIAAYSERSLGNWHRDIVEKLDYLLEQYLIFSGRVIQYRLYLVELAQNQARITGQEFRIPNTRGNHDEPAARINYARSGSAEEMIQAVIGYFDRQEDRLARQMERERDRDLLEVMRKNAEVLRTSKLSVMQIGKTLRNVEHQLDLVANTFTLINTQIRTAPPERILADVDEVVGQSEALTETMEELAPMEEAIARLDRIQAGLG